MKAPFLKAVTRDWKLLKFPAEISTCLIFKKSKAVPVTGRGGP
jgi:hypothetical protein